MIAITDSRMFDLCAFFKTVALKHASIFSNILKRRLIMKIGVLMISVEYGNMEIG